MSLFHCLCLMAAASGNFGGGERGTHFMTRFRMLQKADLALDVAVLLVSGVAMLITGALLFPVSAGKLPYYENGLYGLLLFFFALQAVVLGRTPFGDMRRSRALSAAGVAAAAAGIVTCFVPGAFHRLPRLILFVCLFPGGLLLLVRMLLSRDKLRSWIQYGGVFRPLIPGCVSVYLLSMLTGLLILKQDLLSPSMTGVAVLAFGGALLRLALVLQKIYGEHPEAAKASTGDGGLPFDRAMLLLTGVFMLLLGILLVPVNFGMLPFSGSAQLGLLMVIFAIQMLASGSTPVGPFPRSRLMILAGILFAALGTTSCIIPGILVPFLTLLVGALNIAGGILSLAKLSRPFLKRTGDGQGKQVHPLVARVSAAQLAMNILSVLFGTSMFVSGLIPGAVLGVILACNGCVLLYLMRLLSLLERMQGGAPV